METMEIKNAAPQKNGDRVESPKKDVARGAEFLPMFWGANPFTAMRRMMDDMDRMFDDWKLGRELTAPWPGREWFARELDEFGKGMWAPRVEVLEQNGQFLVRADLPGMSKDDITIEVEDNALVLKGERKQEEEEKKEGYYKSERRYGSFYRRIPLPTDADIEKSSAKLDNGVLEISFVLPERKNNKRQIEIQ